MATPATHLLFVYGSLRSGFHHPAYQYISRYFLPLGSARVKGTLYDMGDYPVARPEGSGKYIVGELYQIKHTDEWDWAIAQLDDYEGVQADEEDGPALYERSLVTVEIGETTETAWIYWYAGEVNGRPIVTSGDVLEYLQRKNQ
ncbi:MAG: gamma-glutamylcyclotransferase family protein [Sediminibacterium sp.]|jgi:gamma-glutamylcyclotransferase (GGCT)/AIG2-like uncharacterized protein YtfP|nr:gamma-glutamylcyclotransferase [Chitinophagaceae bacterium]MCE2974601.1 gamma-glutamylcyclotransferase [Sediminibacterium sp.]MCA6484340.1 gamma-glutamylcyclotransferase [Chitinophagaceae bacterium]MCA6495591.1 gamma-glutamylcyclotransferase [Chitinophagaceae bacterium]MCA6499254.1 gamma-glutamylcyclotransferase [Chitinophagaceae bacterium]